MESLIDLSRFYLRRAILATKDAPPPGHQGILLSSTGLEPVVRLQAGGLKVGQVMARVQMSASDREESCNRAEGRRSYCRIRPVAFNVERCSFGLRV